MRRILSKGLMAFFFYIGTAVILQGFSRNNSSYETNVILYALVTVVPAVIGIIQGGLRASNLVPMIVIGGTIEALVIFGAMMNNNPRLRNHFVWTQSILVVGSLIWWNFFFQMKRPEWWIELRNIILTFLQVRKKKDK